MEGERLLCDEECTECKLVTSPEGQATPLPPWRATAEGPSQEICSEARLHLQPSDFVPQIRHLQLQLLQVLVAIAVDRVKGLQGEGWTHHTLNQNRLKKESAFLCNKIKRYIK